MDRASVARLAGMERQTLRDWVHRFAARLREIAQAHPQPSGFFVSSAPQTRSSTAAALPGTGCSPKPAASAPLCSYPWLRCVSN